MKFNLRYSQVNLKLKIFVAGVNTEVLGGTTSMMYSRKKVKNVNLPEMEFYDEEQQMILERPGLVGLNLFIFLILSSYVVYVSVFFQTSSVSCLKFETIYVVPAPLSLIGCWSTRKYEV